MQREVGREEELIKMRRRYAARGKEGKSRLLDEFCEHYEYSRKHAIKLMADCLPGAGGHAKPGPESRYEPAREVIERIWRSAEQICGKRLKPALSLWLPHYGRHYGKLLPKESKLVQEISAATLDRMLAKKRAQAGRGRSGTKPGSLLRTQIPLTGEVWDEEQLGYLEADTVAHCGMSLAGEFVWSLTYTDLASVWTEGRAMWNKGAEAVVEQTRDVEQSVPFAIRGFDCDNGSEFLNWHLVRYFQEREQPVRFTRSRPYHKDDNAHVEQKNWMWPRQLLGYGRLEDPQAVRLINALYKEVWAPLQNFFLPSMKLVKKERIKSRIVRVHDKAKTAYERLVDSGSLESKQARRLRDWFGSLDPFELSRAVEERLKPILGPSAARVQKGSQEQESSDIVGAPIRMG